ncbi:putative chromatin regulator PHD family [Helianthus anomalus]
MINQTRQQTKNCLDMASQNFNYKINHEDADMDFEKTKREIEANQDNALNLCTEKVLLARQAYELGKLPADEPAILPPLPLVPKNEKRKLPYITPYSKKVDYRDREWDHRDRDFELMPPPGGFKRDYATPLEIEQPIDPNEPTYCVCHQVSYGDMIACDNENCQGGEWFHYSCVGLTPETRFKGKWYCPTCRQLPL